jgi:hypothetical protein
MKIILPLAVMAVASLTLTPVADGQTLAEGMWTGTIEPPEGEIVDVRYEVKNAGDVMTVALLPPEGIGAESRYEFSDVRFENGNLVFWWEPGHRVDCVLEPLDGGEYEGECTGGDGRAGYLSMVPPGHDGDHDGS